METNMSGSMNNQHAGSNNNSPSNIRQLLTVTVCRDHNGYGMTVSGDSPVYVQTVKEGGAAWRAGLRAKDTIVRVGQVNVQSASHTQVVQLIRAQPNVLLTVYSESNKSKLKTPTSITAPQPIDHEKQKQVEFTKISTIKLMLETEQQNVKDLRAELSTNGPDSSKQKSLSSSEERCAKLQNQIDIIMATMPSSQGNNTVQAPCTPKSSRHKSQTNLDKTSGKTAHQTNMGGGGFFSALPRSLSSLTSQSIRNMNKAKHGLSGKNNENSPPVERPGEEKKRSPTSSIPVTCLDGVPPPLPPRTSANNKRCSFNTSGIPVNPLAKPMSRSTPTHKQIRGASSMEKSYPSPRSPQSSIHKLRRSSHSLELEQQPNSLSTQMCSPLTAVGPPSLQNDMLGGSVPVMHLRSQSSPEHLDQVIPYSEDSWEPPPGTPPPPYPRPNLQPCIDPQRAIISMEEDDSPSSESSSRPSLFSNLRSVLESKARMAVVLNWLLAERRSPNASLFLLLTDAYHSSTGVTINTLRRWAYEIHSTFVMPDSVLSINGVDENIAREIDDVLLNDYEKEELLRSVFRKARVKAKDEFAKQLNDFQVKRQVGLSMLYGPEDSVLEKCDEDKTQETATVERIICGRLSAFPNTNENEGTILAAFQTVAMTVLHVRVGAINGAIGNANTRPTYLQRDKQYKQRVKLINKQHPQPLVIRGHNLTLHTLTTMEHCQHCQNIIWGIAPQAFTCTVCGLRIHRSCYRMVEETCVAADPGHNRISRLMERISHNQGQDKDSERKSKKQAATAMFLNTERSIRRTEDDGTVDSTSTPNHQDAKVESDESLYESADWNSDGNGETGRKLDSVPSISKESLKIVVTDEETEKPKKGHRKALSLSTTIEMVKSFGEDFIESMRKESDTKKSRESLYSLHSEDDRISVSSLSLKTEEKKSRRISMMEALDAPRKIAKAGSVSALNFLKKRKNPSSTVKAIEAVVEVVDKSLASPEELISSTMFFLEAEKLHSSGCVEADEESVDEEESDAEVVRSRPRKVSRSMSRNKSRVRGRSQTVKVVPLKKSHSGTLKKRKKKKKLVRADVPPPKSCDAVDGEVPVKLKKLSLERGVWPFHSKESRRENAADEAVGGDTGASGDSKDDTTTDGIWRQNSKSGKPVSRAESCREPTAAGSTRHQRGKQRNASDPNRLTANRPSDAEGGGHAAGPSDSSSSSSLSLRSNDSAPVQHEAQAASQSDWSEEEDVLAEQWSTTVPQEVAESLSPKERKRQELIHELITSENSHVRWLKVLQKVFLRPLERKENSHLLTQDELKSLFPNLHAVRERHSRLYMDLRVLRKDSHVVSVGPVADAVLATLGEPQYAVTLSKFCGRQRLALESLRERRKKNKELHSFLVQREQSPLCGRLQLRDILPFVWQRLTKYRLLLENILRTVTEENEPQQQDGTLMEDDEVTRLRAALTIAKQVLYCVDKAINDAENEHRLRTIQSKLSVSLAPSVSAAEADELKKLDLPQHTLVTEGELSVRCEANKKQTVTALFLSECLVLLHKEGDKFILKHIHSPHPQTPLLSPIIKWNTVLFRPNAALKNTFLLINIYSNKMLELTASTTADYNTWTRYISLAPLADAKAKHSSTNAENGVSRNPSDASRTSATSSQEETGEAVEEGKQQAQGTAATPPPQPLPQVERPRAVIHQPEEPGARVLESPDSVQIRDAEPELIARRTYTDIETLRRLDESITRAINAKNVMVADMLHIPESEFTHVSEMAVADTLGDDDVRKRRDSCASDVRPGRARYSRSESLESCTDNVQQILLAAHTQATQLMELINQALNLNESQVIAARQLSKTTHALCDSCAAKSTRPAAAASSNSAVEREVSFDMLSELGDTAATDEGGGGAAGDRRAPPRDHDDVTGVPITPVPSAATLAYRLSPIAAGLQHSVTSLLSHTAALQERNDLTRRTNVHRHELKHREADERVRRSVSATDESNSTDLTLQDHDDS